MVGDEGDRVMSSGASESPSLHDHGPFLMMHRKEIGGNEWRFFVQQFPAIGEVGPYSRLNPPDT